MGETGGVESLHSGEALAQAGGIRVAPGRGAILQPRAQVRMFADIDTEPGGAFGHVV